MWHGEIRIDPESHRLADQVNRAGNIAAACFFTAEVIAGWLLMRSGLASLFNLHWPIKFFGLLIVMILCSYVLVMFSLKGKAPDLVFDFERVLRNWFMRIAA